MGGTTLQASLNLKIQGRFFISLIATCLISKGESEVETKKKIKPRAIVATHADDCPWWNYWCRTFHGVNCHN